MSKELLEELANAVAAKLGENAAAAVVIDLPELRVRVTEDGTMYEVFLGNAYEEYVRASVEERPAIVAKYAMVVDKREIAPPTQAEWQMLLPKLVPRRERELLRLRFEAVQNLTSGIAITESLLLDLAIDLPQSIRMISASNLADANMTEAEAFELARRNLLGRSREPWQLLVPGLYQSPWGDYFDGARLALPTLFARIGVRGDPIVTLPNRCAMLVTGSEEPVGLAALYRATRMLMEKERPLHLGGLRLVDGRWRELGEDDLDVVRIAPSLLFLSSLQEALDYEAVGDRVREAIVSLGYHVEPLHTADNQGVLMTVTNLPRRHQSLVIPKADMVICGDDDMFAWYKLEAMLGRNLAPLDVWPPHYEVRRLPTLVEIKAARVNR
jgi:hypothetical protein